MAIFDVAIVGAGPAGSALAIELASEGYAVALLDAAAFPRDKPCGDYVSPKGLARIEALGCGGAIQALRCTPIQQSRLYLNRDLLVAGSIPHVPGFPTHGHAIPRKELDDVLFRRALHVGATGYVSCRVKGFEAGRTGVELNAQHDGKPLHVSARLVVGADGANSVVAQVAGMRMNDARYTLPSMRAYVHGLDLDRTIMYFDEEFFPGYGWVFPVRRGLCNVGVGMVKETLVRNGLRLGDFYAKFQRFVRRLADARGVRVEFMPVRGWPIRTYGGAGRNVFHRGLLIGEAGCFVDPINGEGIPMALESAHLAAQTIRSAFAHGRFDDAQLVRYQRAWQAAFDPDLAISDLVVSLIRNRHLLPLWLTLFRTMSLTARDDEHYARMTGGVLAGVVPARQCLTPEMFIRALAHSPGFWRRALGLDGRGTWADWLGGGFAFLRWQSRLVRALADDGTWFAEWLREVERKQQKVGSHALRVQAAALLAPGLS
jgi:menaquinone-9 beta-reductase